MGGSHPAASKFGWIQPVTVTLPARRGQRWLPHTDRLYERQSPAHGDVHCHFWSYLWHIGSEDGLPGGPLAGHSVGVVLICDKYHQEWSGDLAARARLQALKSTPFACAANLCAAETAGRVASHRRVASSSIDLFLSVASHRLIRFRQSGHVTFSMKMETSPRWSLVEGHRQING